MYNHLTHRLYFKYNVREGRDTVKSDFSHFKNTDCEYFPCHQKEGEFFNCLFCYCPLYALGERCGGHFTYTPQGVKDCSHCLIPHSEGGYRYIMSKLGEVSKLAEKKE